MQANKVTAFVVLVLLALNVISLYRIGNLQSELVANREQITALQRTVATLDDHLAALGKQTAELQTQIENLQATLTAGQDQDDGEITAVDVDVATLPDGVYEHNLSIELQRIQGGTTIRFERNFTINAVKLTIGTEAHHLPVVMGLATCLGAPQFFVDYNGDGLVDMQLMGVLVEFIPYGHVITSTMTAHNSQTVYNAFLVHHQDAVQTPTAELTDKVGAVPKAIMELIRAKADMILAWHRGNKANPPAAPMP